jgi:ubiquitin carboxyl-terminal hydrolase 8
LHEYMQKGSNVVRLLLIDVRSREDFDDGHILSQSTICVEPAVLARGDVSAAQIEESMGIAPDEEMQAFEQRGKFDVVVFYDQDSEEMPRQPSQNTQQTILYTLYQALAHYNYDGELRNAPKLLAGGVDAWVDVFGQRSLKESQTSAAVKDGQTQRPRANGVQRSGFTNRRRRTQTKTLQPEELRRFEEVVKHDTAAIKSPMEFVRSTEEFLRRYPSAGDIEARESMVSPDTSSSPAFPTMNDPYQPDLPPAPPTRPAPSVPRTSYSGLSSRENSADVVYAKAGNVVGIASLSSAVPSGLINRSNRCYANALIQSMLASPGFAAEMTGEEWPQSRLPPGISRENKKHPQLMAQILGNLFQWLSKRQMKALEPTTLLASQIKHVRRLEVTD